MNTPAAAAMGYQCDAVYPVTRPHETTTDEYTYQLRCKGEAVARVIICKDGRTLTVKRCAGCLNLLHVQAGVGRVVIESEVEL